MKIKKVIVTMPIHTMRWFQDLAIATAKSLNEIGYVANVIASNSVDEFNGEDYDLVFVLAPHGYTEKVSGIVENFERHPSKVYACWDMEQTPLDTQTSAITQKHFQRAKRYIDKYDFFFTESQSKVDFWQRNGIRAHLFNVGYHKHYTFTTTKFEKDFDVYFAGAPFNRRVKILQKLRERGLKLYPAKPNGFFDPKARGEAIRASKVCLNIHHNEVQYFEKPRVISEIMAHKGLCITETIAHPENYKSGTHFVMVDYDKMVDTIIGWVNKRQEERDAIAENAYKLISSINTSSKFTYEMMSTIEGEQEKRVAFTGERNVPGQSDTATEEQHIQRYEHFLHQAIDKDVLDAGCGAGYGSNLMAQVAKSVTGIDIDQAAIDHCLSKYSRPAFKRYDLLDCGLKSESFDLITSFEVMEHISDYELYLSEMKRMLKTKGMFLVSTPNVKKVSKTLSYPTNVFHIKEWTMEDYYDVLKKYFSTVQLWSQPDERPWPVRYGATEEDLFYIGVCIK